MSKNVIVFAPSNLQSVLTAALIKLFMNFDEVKAVSYNRIKGHGNLSGVKNVWFIGVDVKESHLSELCKNNPGIFIHWLGFSKQTDPSVFTSVKLASSYKAEPGDNLVEFFSRISKIDFITKDGTKLPFNKNTFFEGEEVWNSQKLAMDTQAVSLALGCKGYDDLTVITAEQAVTCWKNAPEVLDYLNGKNNSFELSKPTKSDFDNYLANYRQVMQNVEANHRMEIFQSPMGGKITAAIRMMNCDESSSRMVRKIICDPHGEAITYADTANGRLVIISSPYHAEWIMKQLKPVDSWWVGEALHLLLPSKHISD